MSTEKRMITLPKKTNDKLAEVPNVSALVTLLLEAHFDESNGQSKKSAVDNMVKDIAEMEVTINELYTMIEYIKNKVDEMGNY